MKILNNKFETYKVQLYITTTEVRKIWFILKKILIKHTKYNSMMYLYFVNIKRSKILVEDFKKINNI